MEKQGKIQISSENMMPIIKKWLYSDKDIFLREIVSNGIDAITKFKKLVSLGEASEVEGEEYCVKISVDKDAKTLTVEDNGIGMTADEVEKYITQIAFSGAADFVSKYEKAGGDGIIGHFGLGFYSAYMVSENIEIFTKSYKDEPAVRWESDGNSDYTIAECDKQERGTKIVLHLFEEEKEFLDDSTVKGLIRKYCSFMPYNIYFDYKGDGKDTPINTTSPLYMKNPKECTKEEYLDFYRDTFMDFNEPLFWIHLNMDYPFKLQGILYFPKVRNKAELERGKVKLYCNQVYIADNIKEIIPEYLMLLNGVIDCPDIPLNVSRSFLQNDKQVQKITKHITKKVADKLNSLFNTEREEYEKCWSDTSTFIKYGCIKDDDFYQKVKDIIIFKNLSGEYKSIKEFLGVENIDDIKEEKTVYYASDEVRQAQYVKMFKNAGLDALTCDTMIDTHFITFLEYKDSGKIKFVRIDADIDAALKGEGAEDKQDEVLIDIFKNAIDNGECTVKTQALKDENVPAVVNVEEYARRYSEMSEYYGMSDKNENITLIVNTNNALVNSLKGYDEDKRKFVAKQIYYIALMSFKPLKPDEMDSFVENNMTLLNEYVK